MERLPKSDSDNRLLKVFRGDSMICTQPQQLHHPLLHCQGRRQASESGNAGCQWDTQVLTLSQCLAILLSAESNDTESESATVSSVRDNLHSSFIESVPLLHLEQQCIGNSFNFFNKLFERLQRYFFVRVTTVQRTSASEHSHFDDHSGAVHSNAEDESLAHRNELTSTSSSMEPTQVDAQHGTQFSPTSRIVSVSYTLHTSEWLTWAGSLGAAVKGDVLKFMKAADTLLPVHFVLQHRVQLDTVGNACAPRRCLHDYFSDTNSSSLPTATSTEYSMASAVARATQSAAV